MSFSSSPKWVIIARITIEVKPWPKEISQKAGVRKAWPAVKSPLSTLAARRRAAAAVVPAAGAAPSGSCPYSCGRLRISRVKGKAIIKVKTPKISAVHCQPNRCCSGSMAQAIAGTSSNAPIRLPTLAQPIAVARRRENQLLIVVINGSQLPKPWPKAITIKAR